MKRFYALALATMVLLTGCNTTEVKRTDVTTTEEIEETKTSEEPKHSEETTEMTTEETNEVAE